MANVRGTVVSASLVLFIVGFPIGFMWQGLDVTDTGYALANCQQFFNSGPQNALDPVVASVWLTYLIDGIWYKLTGDCGLIGFRVLYLLITSCILILTWLALRSFGKTQALTALSGGAGLVIASSLYLPSYNEFTALLFVLTAVAFYFGIVNDNRVLIFIAGTAGALSTFARLPNLMITGIIVAIFFYRWIEAPDPWQSLGTRWIKRVLQESAVFCFGYFFTLGAVLGVMALLGYLPVYWAMLQQMLAMASDPTQHHGGWPLLKGLLHDYFYAAIFGIFYFIGAFAAGWAVVRWPNRLFRISLIVALAVALTGLQLYFGELQVYLWPGVIYATLLTAALGFLNLTRRDRLLCVLAAIVLFLIPLGSDNGLHNAVYGMYLAAPVALIVLIGSVEPAEVSSNSLGLKGGRSGVIAPIPRSPSLISYLWKALHAGQWKSRIRLDRTVPGYVIFCSMAAFSLIHRWHFTYRDSPNRTEMRSGVDHPKLRCVLTTPSRAKSLNELLKQLQPLVHKNDFLLDHMQLPLIYFLTETKPYLYSSWANLYYPAVFKRALDRAVVTRPLLPVCIKTRVDTSHPEWPDETYPPSEAYRFVENRRLVEAFLESHNYRKYWENKAFEIWLPPSAKNKG